MKAVLINPPPASEFDRHWARFPVLGLAYLAASLRAEPDCEVVLLDGKLAQLSIDEITSRTLELAPDFVGITCMTVEFPAVVALAAALKARSNIPIIIGGAHVNAVQAQALEECGDVDFACVGEGELLIREFALALREGADAARIPGLISRKQAEIQFAGSRPYPKDYDALPFPAWDLFDVGEQIPVLTHRGCPFQCTFCGHNSGFKARFRTPENVVAEIEHDWRAFKPKVIRFEDETFGLDLKRTKRIISLLIEKGLHKRVRFSAQTRVDKIDAEFIDLMKTASFETLELGVESGNPAILESIKKKITLEQVERAVALAKARGIKVWCKFILGHPHETLETIKDTMRFISKLNPDQLSVSIMTPFPGTPIHAMALKGEGGYVLLDRGWQSYDKYSTGVLELKNVSLAQLKMYQILCYARLYLFNWRFLDAFMLVWKHFAMAREMLYGAALQFLTRSKSLAANGNRAA